MCVCGCVGVGMRVWVFAWVGGVKGWCFVVRRSGSRVAEKFVWT